MNRGWLLVSVLIALAGTSCARVVYDVSQLSPVDVSSIVKPRSIQELQKIVTSTNKPLSIAGGRFSQGGQIAYPNGIVIDMIMLAKIVKLDVQNKKITVQAGARWSDVQKYIDPYRLSVDVMQSYNDFTVGGSIAVNVHGRSLKGSLIKTIDSLKILLADGSFVVASRSENGDLFRAVIGGYGLLGIVVEATLNLTDNIKIERSVHMCSIEEYEHYFFDHIHGNSRVVFHNANLYPDDFRKVICVTWLTTDKKLTVTRRLQKQGLYLKELIEEQILRRIPASKEWRKEIDVERLQEPEIVWRNYEMSYSVESLEPLIRFPTTSILQEYFVPVGAVSRFVDAMRSVFNTHEVNVLNVSLRYVPRDEESMLAYAPRDSFALVCYINVARTVSQKPVKQGKIRARYAWTQALVNAVLAVNGSYYLPYHLWIKKDQFQQAYPGYESFMVVKRKYDPVCRFMNCLYGSYLADDAWQASR